MTEKIVIILVTIYTAFVGGLWYGTELKAKEIQELNEALYNGTVAYYIINPEIVDNEINGTSELSIRGDAVEGICYPIREVPKKLTVDKDS